MNVLRQEDVRLLWPFYVFRFLSAAVAFVIPFIVVYYQQRGLSFAQISLLWTVMGVVSIVCEVPTGILADAFSRKWSAILGYVIEGLSWLAIPFTSSFAQLLAVCIVLAVGQTFVSGALEAWVYDELKRARRQNLIQKYYARNFTVMFAGMVIGPALGSVLAARLPLSSLFVIEGIAEVLVCSVLLFSRESFVPASSGSEGRVRAFVRGLRAGSRLAWSRPTVRLLFVASSAFMAWFAFHDLSYQPLLVMHGMPAEWLGYFLAIIGFFGAFTPFLGVRLSRRFGERFAMLAPTIIIALGSFGILWTKAPFFILTAFLVGGLDVVRGALWPVFRGHLQHSVPSGVRATVLSAESMVSQLVHIIALAIGGWMLDAYGPQATLAWGGVVAMLPAIVAFVLLRTDRLPINAVEPAGKQTSK